jgi:hypothetical protein
MKDCLSCGGDLVRVRRTFLEKFVYHAVLKCKQCGSRETRDQWFLFLFGKKSRCPRCGSFRVEKLRSVDHIDPMYRNPLSRLQKYIGGNIHWCPFCRLQFYDIRKKEPTVKRAPRVASPPPAAVGPARDMAKSGD